MGRKSQKRNFQKMYLGAIEAVDQKSKAMIMDYKLYKKQTRQKLASNEFSHRAVDLVNKEKKEHVTELRHRTQHLRERLLELEMFQIEQYEDLIAQFEEKYGEIK